MQAGITKSSPTDSARLVFGIKSASRNSIACRAQKNKNALETTDIPLDVAVILFTFVH